MNNKNQENFTVQLFQAQPNSETVPQGAEIRGTVYINDGTEGTSGPTKWTTAQQKRLKKMERTKKRPPARTVTFGYEPGRPQNLFNVHSVVQQFSANSSINRQPFLTLFTGGHIK